MRHGATRVGAMFEPITFGDVGGLGLGRRKPKRSGPGRMAKKDRNGSFSPVLPTGCKASNVGCSPDSSNTVNCSKSA